MPVITITTEWQGQDYFNGVLKGKLASNCAGCTIIENATGIPPLNIQHTAFVVRNTFRHYPEGTIHIICVNSEFSDEQPHLLVEYAGHYFLGSDNGIFFLILNSEPDGIVVLDNKPDNKDNKQFNEIEVFARAAGVIAAGGKITDAGKKTDSFREKIPLRATIDENAITGSIIFIDSYGNAISNITRELFARVFKGKKFQVNIKSNNNAIYHISDSYKSEPVSELIATFNSLDLLEIGINGSNASELLGFETGDVVRISVQGNNKKPGTLF